MTALMHYYFNAATGEIIAKDAEDATQAGVHFTTPEELAASTVTTADLLKWVNSDKTGDDKVKKFADRLSGAKRIFKELGHLDATAEAELAAADASKAADPAPTAPATASEAPAAASTPADASEAGKRGRKSRFEGKTITNAIAPNQEGVVVNPRRADTHGWRSLNLVIAAGAKGISYEDYIAKGGRNNDLTWDHDHKYVTVA